MKPGCSETTARWRYPRRRKVPTGVSRARGSHDLPQDAACTQQHRTRVRVVTLAKRRSPGGQGRSLSLRRLFRVRDVPLRVSRRSARFCLVFSLFAFSVLRVSVVTASGSEILHLCPISSWVHPR
uniref:Transmembrane protein n=1 Tax=Rousettus aegyptiacus TaxID=9407 RepID=A0A7J8HRM7_ROUAE|nr:hypothetical protein HJG63_011109 [Rousettus aegyptiacus]